MSMRTEIEEVLDLADRIDRDWSEVLTEAGSHCPPPKAWEADDDARRDLAASATAVLRDLLARVDKGEDVDLTPEAPTLIVMEWDGGPEEEPYEAHSLFLDHRAIYTVCPRCWTVNGGIVDVDRCERWNEAEVDVQPDTIGDYQVIAGRGMVRVGSKANPLAGLPVLTIHQDKNSDFHTDRHACGTCREEIELPEWVISAWM